ncbi:hypothetical protein D9757_014714 [Collybiopsis confluens]|uniref:Ataxin-10 homolog n=1 Tax=Collybiopsis confluens TaxID=2823264 RepID=A0A8H5CB62_9AGAR|nr:hypothetical protein D9757_014714 [Collybiopsis confluens]
MSLIARFKEACSIFEINAIDTHSDLCRALDALAADLAKDIQARSSFFLPKTLLSHLGLTRKQLGAGDVWTDLSKLWKDLVHAQLTFWDGDDSDDGQDDGSTASAREKRKQSSLCALCVSFARFTRNLVAVRMNLSFDVCYITTHLGHPCKTKKAMKNLISTLWETYLNLQEDQVVLIRLLTSPDSRILLAVLTMIAGCLHESRTRTKLLTRTAIGARICVTMLDDMVKLYDADEASDGARAFDVGYSIFTRIIESGLMSDLYVKLAMSVYNPSLITFYPSDLNKDISRSDEIVTPHQSTLLKLLDSYLQSAPISSPGTRSRITRMHARLCPMLSNLFFALSTYAQRAIRKSLRHSVPGTNSDGLVPPAELDVLLPKVCEALVLVAQCIITIILTAQSHSEGGLGSAVNTASSENAHSYFNQVRFEGVGLAESLVELLRLLDRFLPRINFGKPVGGTGESADITQTAAPAPGIDNPGFNFLKRDLVRLLGILCNENRAVQDRLRKCGGIEVVMNLCAIDDRNPYLREHAIFALHNLLKDNPANQAVVEEIKPMGKWDDNGILRDTPGAVRK